MRTTTSRSLACDGDVWLALFSLVRGHVLEMAMMLRVLSAVLPLAALAAILAMPSRVAHAELVPFASMLSVLDPFLSLA